MTSTESSVDFPRAEKITTNRGNSAILTFPVPQDENHALTVSGETTATVFDRIGIVLSGLCMVHCMVLPLLVPFITTMAAFAHSEWMHIVLAILIVPTVVFSAWSGYRLHHKASVVWLLGLGTALVLMGMLTGTFFANELLETVITTAGSGLLIAGHWQNHIYRSTCENGMVHVH
jgi:hypothetical protein